MLFLLKILSLFLYCIYQKLWRVCAFILLAVAVQSLSCVQLFATPWTASFQGSLSFSNIPELLKFMSTKSVMPSNHLLCHSLLLLPSIFPSNRVFSDESALHIRWTNHWSFVILWNPSFSWVYLSLSPLLFASLLSSAICKVS